MAYIRLRIKNPDLNKEEKTTLDADYASGDITLTVVSNSYWEAEDFVIVGEPGEDKTEYKRVTGITSNTTINLASALKFTHNKGTPVYRNKYDEVEISRKAVGGSWTVISESALQWDKHETLYTDHSGALTASYRYRFRSTTRGDYSDYSPTLLGSGYTEKSVGYMMRQVRMVIRDPEGKIATNREIVRLLNEAQDIVKNERDDWWFFRKEDSSITTTDGTFRYSLSALTDLSRIDTVRYRYNDGSNTDVLYHLHYVPYVEFDYLVRDQDRVDDDWVEYYSYEYPDSSSDTGYLLVFPTPATTDRGTFYIRYFIEPTTLDDVADETEIAIPRILENYAISVLERVKGNETKAAIYEDAFKRGLENMKLMEVASKKVVGQPKQMWRFRGQNPLRRFYKERNITRDYLVENYF